MRNMRGILPGIFTMGNLACGFGAIVIAGGARHMEFPDQFNALQEAARLITLAAFFDLLDGFVARFSKSSSEFGVQLDSIADIVSFGVAPAVLIINFSLVSQGIWSWILAFVFVMAASFRLARFNLTATLESKSNFVGLSVPVAALSIVSFILFINEIRSFINFDEGLVAGIGFMINFSLVLFPLIMIYIIFGLLQFVRLMFTKNGKTAQGYDNGDDNSEDKE